MKAVSCIWFLLIAIYLNNVEAKSRISQQKFISEVNKYLDTGKGSKSFYETIDLFTLEKPYKGRNPTLNFKLNEGRAGNRRRKVSCTVCNVGINLGLGWIRLGRTRDQVAERAVNLCVLLNIQKRHVCQGFVDAHVDIALWIVNARKKEKNIITSAEVCGLALYPDCGEVKFAHHNWTLDLSFMGEKPEFEEPEMPAEGTPMMKVLHLTDAHVDLKYQPGANAKCEEPTCCRSDQVKAAPNNISQAGYWGDYRDCDSPMHAFVDLVRHAKETHPDLDYIMYSGDSVDHAMWNTSIQGNTDTIIRIIKEIRSNFPDITLLPILGNHEPHPLNVFIDEASALAVPAEFSTEWLYDLSVDLWSEWLPDIKDTLYKGGFYSHEITPGLLVIALNNNYCYTFNWWLIYSSHDPSGQLIWLANKLLEAEQAGKKVHILAHIPGNDPHCFAPWRRHYQRIVERFENTIVAQFHGHSHNDHFSIYYDPKNTSRATNVAFTAGSATTYTDVNPNYRVYDIDPETFRVIDHETWFYNLTEANLAGPDVPPNWQKLYTFTDAYEVPSLLPQDMDELVHRMAANETLQQQYWGHYIRLADTSMNECDTRCMQELVCDIITADPFDPNKCSRLPLNKIKNKNKGKISLLPTANDLHIRALLADDWDLF